jgi:hypothetical protein
VRAKQRYVVILGIGLLTALFLSLWVELLSNALVTQNAFEALASMGWSHLWMVLMIGSVVMNAALAFRWSSHDQSILAAEEPELRRSVLRTAVAGIRALRSHVAVNARFFCTEIENGRTLLRKDYDIHIETVHMPGEFGLDYAVVGEDDLGICEAFQQRKPVYRVLSENRDRYAPRIRTQIDPHQKWVLACPVFDPDNHSGPPIGVICFYSTEEIIRKAEHIIQLQQVAISAAEAIECIRSLRNKLALTTK